MSSPANDTDRPEVVPVDRLSALFDRFRVRARMFHRGALCGVTSFPGDAGVGYLHVLRRGRMQVRHPRQPGGPRASLEVAAPSLLFYPRPLAHDFVNPPVEGSELVCATLDFDGGASHPLARSLPPLVIVPLAEAAPLAATLDLLFGEADRARCGQRLLADRLFEVLLIQLLRWLLDRRDGEALPAGVLAGLAEPRLARALVAMHESPGAAWTLESLARRAGMSRSAFAAAFRRVVGQTPAEHLAHWRLAVAQQRLAAGEALKLVALDVGYGSAAALSRAFTARLGRSPRAWRAAQRQVASTPR